MSTRVAILGTGRMGSAVARRLTKLEPTLWNRSRARAEQVGVGRVAATPAAAVSDADIVISSLTGAGALRSTFGGPEGALAAAHGQLFVEMSTSGTAFLEEIEPQLRARGSGIIDAPILGAPTVVLQGGAAVLVGGSPADQDRARPVLKMLGQVHSVGPLGSGARLKLVANSMLAAITLAAAELQVAGEAAGLDQDQVFWALARLAPGLETRRAGYLDRRHEPTLFAVRDLLKDLDLALEQFRRSTVRAPLTTLVRGLVSEAAEVAAELDITAVIDQYGLAPAAADTSRAGIGSSA
ncbi:MAG TPA: NAD(P)-binding domain-containing protein [Candidatus Nanopelagicaceae bacterium]|nr:NAD(P)-binding domain-containing protein [Candidatus Nanopelagicaceae bacterium]